MEFNQPLIGSREANYKFFYCTGGVGIASLCLLFLITGYTAYVSTNIGGVVTDMTEVLDGVKTMLPEANKALQLLENLCNHANFTRTFGDLCGK